MEAALLVAGYAAWNRTGYQSYRLAVAAMVAGAVKSAVGRCVLLTAALGWGVTKESLQFLTAAGVVLLGAAAVPLELLIDLNHIMTVRDERHQTFLSATRDAAEPAQNVVGRQNLAYFIFAVWTAGALGWTMWALWKTRQTRKLGRYLRLAAVLLLSSLVAAAIAAVAQSRMARDIRYALLQQKAEGAVFFLALAGVACLWRPCESAREYAYFTQLPSSEFDDDDAGEADSGGLARGEREADVHVDVDESKTTSGSDDESRSADDAIAADAPGEIKLPKDM
jgi:Lung seven transmembrane receptor